LPGGTPIFVVSRQQFIKYPGYALAGFRKSLGNGPKRHTGRDEVEIRYPLKYCFFWIPDSRFATSGMTDLAFALKISSFSAACWAPVAL
jgi:hypothetical protein